MWQALFYVLDVENGIIKRKSLYVSNMNYYQSFIKLLQEQQVVVQSCNLHQIISNQAIVSYYVVSGTNAVMQHQLMHGEQKIYVFVEQGSVATLTSVELPLQLVDDSIIDFVIVVEQDAQFRMNFAWLQALQVKSTISVYLQGDRSQADIQGLYALDGQQRVEIKTYQYHLGTYSSSNLVVKGMLKGNAYASYQGLIKIEDSACGTNASQENKNIVLSSGAKVVSVPTIEVLQFDVQCCHGSAIGKFDKESLWYLQSKGFLPEQACECLIRSFFQEVLQGSPNQAEIMDIVCQKMI